MASSEPLETRRLGGEAGALSIELIDAPVSSGTRGAKSGSLMIIVDGSQTGFTAVQPLLEPLGGNVCHVGAVGAAHALKELNNLLSATSLLIAGEVGAKPKLGTEAIELWSRALDALPANADHTEFARWIESEAN